MTTTSGVIVCPRCGERLPQGFTRCDACGAYLIPAPVAESSSGASRGPGRHAPAAAGAKSGVPGVAWTFLLVGIVLGGAVGYALRSGVGPRDDGGAPTGPADIMAGAGTGGAGMGGGTGGMPAGAQMPAEVSAAVQRYRQTLRTDPTNVEANVGLGNLLFDIGRYDQAITHYTTALEKDPGNADVRVDRAIAYHSTNQNEKAKSELERVSREHPEHRNAWLNLGVVSAATGDRADAIRAWGRYLELEPNGEHSAAVRAELESIKKGS